MSELKACPFCGGEAQVVGSWLNDVTSRKLSKLYAIQCGSAENCPAKNYEQDEQGGFACDFYTVEEAVTNWNKRPIEDELQRRIDELTAELAALKSEIVSKDKKLTDYEKELRQLHKYDRTCSTCRYLDENQNCVLGIRCVNYALWQGRIL